MYDVEAVRQANPLREIAEAAGVEWDRRKSVPARGDWWAPCPFHAEKSASFHVIDARGFFKCFGCGASGDVFGFVMQLHGLDFVGALRDLAERGGVGREEHDSAREARRRARQAEIERMQAEADVEAARKLESAARIWNDAQPPGDMLRAYLRARGVLVAPMLDALGDWPPCLREASALPRFGERRGRRAVVHRGPAMVAAIGRDRLLRAVHRTWITPTGRARDRSGATVGKSILGRTGWIFGEPIQFAPPAPRMIVGEGIETVLSVWSRLLARDGPGSWSAEAAVSLGALAGPEDPAGRGGLNPHTGRDAPSALPDRSGLAWAAPDDVDQLVILAEGSAKDPVSAERHARRAERRHAQRSDGTARSVRLALPPEGWASSVDFADVAAAENRKGGAP